jgi:hypothetical protein
MTNLELAILTYAHILPKLHNMAGTMKLTIVASLIVGPLPLHLPSKSRAPASRLTVPCTPSQTMSFEDFKQAWCPAFAWIFQSSLTCC